MGFGFCVSVVLIAIIAGIWIYNDWPEWRLAALGHSVGIPNGSISEIQEEAGQRYRSLCSGMYSLGTRIGSLSITDSGRTTLHDHAEYLSHQTPNLPRCEILLLRLQELQGVRLPYTEQVDVEGLKSEATELVRVFRTLGHIEQQFTKRERWAHHA